MKNAWLLSFILLGTIVNAQNILRVNNTAGVNVPYTTIAAAVTAAGVNDIIMVEGSGTNYGSITIDKKVTIIGPGYLLSENTGLQSNSLQAAFQSVTLTSGAAGSTISGIDFNWFGQTVTLNGVSNIVFSHNSMATGTSISLTGTGSNIFVSGNYLNTFAGNGSYTNVIVGNNYIGGQTVVNSGIITFSNNIIAANGTSAIIAGEAQNNIFLGVVSFNSCTLKNNVFTQGPVAGADGTNIFNVNQSTLFVGLTGNTTDTQWRLKAGSPAIGAGIGGVDCGMYGGATPYKVSGIATGQHTIYSLAVPATTPQNGTLNVQVSAKVN